MFVCGPHTTGSVRRRGNVSGILRVPMPSTARGRSPARDVERSPARRVRLLAYGVTCGILLVFTVAVVTDGEAWPITSFRLFSHVRTDTTASTTLVAVDDDGGEHPVRADADHVFVKRTTVRYATLRSVAPGRARVMVEAWLVSAGLDPADFESVELHRRTSRLHADGSPPEVLDEHTTWRLDLR